MKRLLVFLHGTLAGTLDQDVDGLLVFTYDRRWLESVDSVPLSRSLPLRPEPFEGREARPFFAGILPDEGPRQRVAAILGVSERNDFALLEGIGGDCAGAVSLLTPGADSTPGVGGGSARLLDDAELVRIVTDLPRRPLMAGIEGVRLSLAGAQDKLAVVVGGTDQQIGLPSGPTPSTHILKPEPDRFPGLVANEAFCLGLARAVGLRAPPASIRTVGGRPCLLVERYDRTRRSDGTMARIHQEDFCQALGFPPERKYQQEGGPLLRDCIGLLRSWSTAPVLDIRDFLDGLIFNVLIGNADAHGKNHSLLYQGGERRLAPLYDLVCTLAWPELSKIPAMKIGRSETLDSITVDHWRRMADESRLGWPLLRERVERMAGRVVAEVADAGTPGSPAAGSPGAGEVARIVLHRAKRMLGGAD